jgi:hypothetical protein
MAGGRQDVTGGPELETTQARQAQRSPGAFSMLAISTILGVLAIAIVWLVFAGPFHRAVNPQVHNQAEAATVHEPAPAAKMIAPATSDANPARSATQAGSNR